MNNECIYFKVAEGKYQGREGFCYKSQVEEAKIKGKYVMWYSKEGIHPYRVVFDIKQLIPIETYSN